MSMSAPGYRAGKGRRRTALLLASGCGALAVLGVVLRVVPGGAPAGDYGAWWITNAVGAAMIAIPAYLLATRVPHNPVGWLLLGLAGAHGLTVASREYALHALAPGSQLPLGTWALWLSGWTYTDFVFFVPLYLLIPDGRLASPRWRPVLVAGMVVAVASTVWVATYPGPMLPSGHPLNPLPWPWLARQVGHLGQNTVLIANLVAAGSGLLAMALRGRTASGARRRQIVLIAVAALLLLGETAHEDFVTYAGEEWVGAAALTTFAGAIAAAILRYGLADIDIAASRTVVYGGLTVVLAGAYFGVVAITGVVANTAVPAAIVVAFLFAPVRDRLRRASDRWLFGERDDPYAVMSGLGETIDSSEASDVLPVIAHTLARMLKLPYVAIEYDGEVASVEGRAHQPVSIPLVHAGEQVGCLRLGQRGPGERFTGSERRLFSDLARQVAVAANAERLTRELQRSRGELVATREEERRRLRRDLHDGLGPTLAGMALQIASTRMLLTSNPEAADGLLAQLLEEIQTAIAEVRRLVYALRPPALDELGLVSALRLQAERFAGLDVAVEATEEVGRLPAAVEVAAYRIATEALTNASRHARASRCTITIDVKDDLRIVVRDDGVGLAPGWRPGVGVASIRERAAELGGSCHVGNVGTGGALVQATLPIPVGA